MDTIVNIVHTNSGYFVNPKSVKGLTVFQLRTLLDKVKVTKRVPKGCTYFIPQSDKNNWHRLAACLKLGSMHTKAPDIDWRYFNKYDYDDNKDYAKSYHKYFWPDETLAEVKPYMKTGNASIKNQCSIWAYRIWVKIRADIKEARPTVRRKPPVQPLKPKMPSECIACPIMGVCNNQVIGSDICKLMWIYIARHFGR